MGGDLAVITIATPCYATREAVKLACDFQGPSRDRQVDRAIESASRTIEGELHRVFYPLDTTYKWDWPNYQYAYPWRLWFGMWDLVVATLVQSPNGTTIPLASCIFRPSNRKPGWPYTYLELDRSTVAAFGAGATPQLSIWITGTFGFTTDSDPAGTLAAAISTTTATTMTVSDASQLGAGDLAIIGTERLLVQDKAAAATGLTQSGAGCTTNLNSDNVLATTGAGTLNNGEVLLLDSERMLVTDFTAAGAAVVQRAYDGTVLATHSAAAVSAYRLLTVTRGALGTTAATYSSGTAVNRHRPPSLIRELAEAEAINKVLQATSGWSRMVGEGDSLRPAPGAGLADLWDEAVTTYGRKSRTGAI